MASELKGIEGLVRKVTAPYDAEKKGRRAAADAGNGEPAPFADYNRRMVEILQAQRRLHGGFSKVPLEIRKHYTAQADEFGGMVYKVRQPRSQKEAEAILAEVENALKGRVFSKLAPMEEGPAAKYSMDDFWRLMGWEGKGEWREESVRAEAMRFLIEKVLGKEPRMARRLDFVRNRLGTVIVHHYGSIPHAAVRAVHDYYIGRDDEVAARYDVKAWHMGKVPDGHFDSGENRIEAVEWLVRKVVGQARKITSITKRDFKDNGLGGLLNNRYNGSPYDALAEAGYLVERWEMNVPAGFYRKKANRVAAVEWLAEKVWREEKAVPRDMTIRHFMENGLATVLITYHNASPFSALFEAGLVSEADRQHMHDTLHLEEINDTSPLMLLSSSEREKFSASIAAYGESRANVRNAKLWLSDAHKYDTHSVPMPFYAQYVEVLPRLKGVFDFSQAAISKSNTATNAALEMLLERMEKLERLGAGEPGYGGAASGPYSEMLDLLVQSNNSVLNSERYPDLARRYSAVLSHSKDVEETFYRGGTSFKNPHSFSNALNYQLSGSDNMLALFAGLYRKSLEAEAQMKYEYDGLLLEAEAVQYDCHSIFSALKSGEKYPLITSNIAAEFLPGSSAELFPPSFRISEVSDNPECSGGDGSYLKLAKKMKGSTGMPHYLAKAIILLRYSLDELDGSFAELWLAQDEVDGMLANAPPLAGKERAAAYAAVSSFSAATDAETAQLLRSQALLRAGDVFEDSAASATSEGEVLLAHYTAIQKYRDAALSISEPVVYAAEKLHDANRSVRELQEAVKAADSDGISTDYESDQLALLKAQLKINDAELHSNIDVTAQELSTSLFEKARLQYSFLESEHASLAADFEAMLGDMPPALVPKYSEFLTIDSQYFEGGQLSSSSLGHLESIRSSFAGMRKAIDANTHDAVAKNVQKLYALAAAPEGTPTLDQQAIFTIDLLLPNDLPFAVEGKTTVSIPFPYEVSEADIASKSANIAGIAYSRSTLTVLMDSISAGSPSRIIFRKSIKPAETDSSSEKVLSLSPSLLRKEKTMKLTALYPLDSLRALVPLSSTPSLLSAHVDGVPASAHLSGAGQLSAEVMLRGLSKGSHELKLYYEAPNPYSITQANRQATGTGGTNATISFDIIVSSASETLSDVPVYFVESAGTEINKKSASVIGASSQPASLKIEPSSAGTSFSWKAPLLRPGEPLTYRVQYSVTDLSSYVETLLPPQSAPSFRQQFESELSSFEAEERGYAGANAALRSLSEFTEAENLSRSISTSSSLKSSAMLLAESGQYSEALAALAGARSTLQNYPLAKTFSALHSRLFGRVQDAKADALKLSTFGNASETLSILGSAETHMSSASASATASFWSDAFLELAEADSAADAALTSLKSMELSQIESFSTRYAAYLSQKQNVFALLSKLSAALSFTVGNSEVKKARLDIPIDAEGMKKSLAADEKTLTALAKKLDPSMLSTAIANAPELRQAASIFSSLSEQEQVLAEAQASMERKAELSYENARLMLKQLSELAPRDDKQLADEQSGLTKHLSDSSSALEAGRLLDSLSLSQHVQGRALTALERLPSKNQQPLLPPSSDLAIIALSLLFITGLVFLFARRRPSSRAPPRKLPSAGFDDFGL